jgi:sigma-E factor negative regulatory protein RseB
VSRITHLADATGEHERITNQDGPPRELVRHNDEVTCFFPNATAVRLESRALMPTFPSLLPAQIGTLSQNYSFKKVELSRVAGLDAQAYVFEPKDHLRYAHKFWSDVASGLLLKVRTLNERNDIVEQFMFSDIQVGGKIDKETVKSHYAGATQELHKRSIEAGEGADGATGWQVTELPAGFSKVGEGYRRFPGRSDPVAHLILSDGLVTVSVFIERLAGIPQQLGPMHQGGINIYARRTDDHLVTVLGEAPEITVQRIADSVSRR